MCSDKTMATLEARERETLANEATAERTVRHLEAALAGAETSLAAARKAHADALCMLLRAHGFDKP